MKKVLYRISLILLLICSSTIFFACQKTTVKGKLDTPYNIYFNKLGGDVLAVQISNVLHAENYVLYIDGNEFSSKNGYFEIEQISSSAKTYSFACKVTAKNYTDSDISKNYYYKNYNKLETPKLFITEELITWTGISNAEVYCLCINDKEIECTDTSYNLEKLTGYGKLNIKVKAINKTNEFYLDSDFSNEIIYDISKTIKEPTLIYLSDEKVIKIVSNNVGNNPSFCIKINDIEIITTEKQIDISEILKNEGYKVIIKCYEFYDSGVKSNYAECVIDNECVDIPILISLQNTSTGYKIVFSKPKDGYYHKIIIETNNKQYTFNTSTDSIEVNKECLNINSVIKIKACSINNLKDSDEASYNVSNLTQL